MVSLEPIPDTPYELPRKDSEADTVIQTQEAHHDTANIGPQSSSLAVHPTSPYTNWKCAFGFTGDFGEPAPIPNNKDDFLKTITKEVTTIGALQRGFQSYLRAIKSGEHHHFDQAFLNHQSEATTSTIEQLDCIAGHLREILKKLTLAKHGNSPQVDAELATKYAYAQPWIMRSRAILVSSHVFYKINYVLGNKELDLSL